MNLNVREWQSSGVCINENGSVTSNIAPDVSFLPAMFRRRLSFHARLVFEALNKLSDPSWPCHLPIVFSSRHGELELSLNLIADEQSKSPLSPTSFSLSVHNSLTGLVGLHYKNTAPTNAIAAGKESLHMGLLEASALLLEHPLILHIHLETKLPEIYLKFSDSEQHDLCLITILDRDAPVKKFENFQTIDFMKYLNEQQ
jgi:hypothetical protein